MKKNISKIPFADTPEQAKALQELIRLYRMVTEDQNEKTYHYYHSSSPPDTGAG